MTYPPKMLRKLSHHNEDEVNMLNIISTLLVFVINSFKYLMEFLTIIILGIVGAILYSLPWLLRIVALLLWLGGDYLGITSIQTIYSPISPAIPVIALQFAVILISVGWWLFVLSKNIRLVWGGMAACGLVIGGASIGSIWLLSHWQFADLFFRVLPPTLFSVLLIYETIRIRSIRRNGNMKIESDLDELEENASDLLEIEPAFTQLKNTDMSQVTKLKMEAGKYFK